MKGQSGSRVRLVDARMLSPSVRSLVFEPLGAGFAYRAGQSVQVTVSTAMGLAMRRPYSIASAAGALPDGRFELERWAREPSRVRIEVTLSRPSADWTGRTGYVQRHLAELVRELEPELLMVCGLSPMVDEVERLARELGLPPDAIRTEAYDR